MGIFLQYLFLLLGFTGINAMRKMPHIVLMIGDDLGWNDVSFHGSKQVPTPNIDALARDGIILNQYYVQPICSPSRGCLMTGKHPIRLGFQHEIIAVDSPWGLPLKEKIIPQYLKALGYSTHAVGKWHLGFFTEDYLPLKRGFESFFGYYAGVKDYFTHFSVGLNTTGLDLHDNEKAEWGYNGVYGPDLFTDKAKKIILEHDATKPLFLYFPQQAVHSGNFDTKPLQALEKYVKPMVGIKDEKRHKFAGVISALDYSVGEIITALEISGMLDDTIFIFTTDNGGAPQETEGTSGSNWPLKGGKFTTSEGGVRGVSFIWSSILRRRSRIHSGLMHISDWLPTILSATGCPEALKMLPKGIDGVDQWPTLMHSFPSPRSEILHNIDDVEGVTAIRRGKFKLLKGSYFKGKHDKWYDSDGRVFNITYSFTTPVQQLIYEKNYIQFLGQSKAANILWKKYGKDPRSAYCCTSLACKEQLEVKCGVPPVASTCNALKEHCLFDVISDPCEFYNIAKQFPQVVAELKLAINEHRLNSIPPGENYHDPRANPKFHGGVWSPWL